VESTIADGYLLLSLVPGLLARLIVLQGWSTAINTGVDRCEFPGVVTAGSRVRMGARLARVRVLPGRAVGSASTSGSTSKAARRPRAARA
jgi:acyl dehydratase